MPKRGLIPQDLNTKSLCYAFGDAHLPEAMESVNSLGIIEACNLAEKRLTRK